jgi:hypothetical protein
MRGIMSGWMLGLAFGICQCGESDSDAPDSAAGGSASAGTGGESAPDRAGAGGAPTGGSPADVMEGGASNGGAHEGGASNGGAHEGGASNGGAHEGGASNGGAEAGGTATGGTVTGGTSGDAEGCPRFDACMLGVGGRGNVCGGVIADARWLIGTGFDDHEGARVVGEQGYATIQDGAFELYVGTAAGCNERSAIYRIDTGTEGSCDEDLVYEARGSGPDLRVTGAEPGASLDCASFASGRDLEVSLVDSCFPSCGVLSFEVLDEDGEPLTPENSIFLDSPPFVGHGFSGALEPESRYLLRYWFSCTGSLSGCTSQEIQEFRREFTATDGVNRLTLR